MSGLIKKQPNGYIALVALLIVAAAGLTIGLAVSLRGIEEIQTSYGGFRAAKAKTVAESCLEEGLERLRKSWVNYSGLLSFDSDSCIINTVVADNVANLEAIGTSDIYSQKIKLQVSNTLEVNSWQEY